MTTVQKIVATSLRKIGVLPAGQQPKTLELADARDELRRMLDSWRLESLMVYVQTLRSFELQPGKAVYTYGELGDFEAPRPLKVLAATIHNGAGGTYPLILMEADEYIRLTGRDQSGRPTRFYYQPTFPMGEMRFDCVPDDPTVELLVQEPFDVPGDLATEVDFPPGYEDAIIYNLAARLAGEYDVKPEADVLGLAMSFKKLIKRANLQVPKLLIEHGNVGAFGTYDIYAGPVR